MFTPLILPGTGLSFFHETGIFHLNVVQNSMDRPSVSCTVQERVLVQSVGVTRAPVGPGRTSV